MRTDSRLIGFTARRRRAPVSKRARPMISIRRSLDPIKGRAHPSSRNSSSEFLRSHSSPFIFRCSASPALGFRPSSRHHSIAATIPRDASHAPLRSVLRFSQPLDGFFRSRACRLISSRNHVQGHLSFRGFSPVAATLPLRKELPPCRCCIAARTRAPTFAGSPCRPRTTPLGFEASICAGPRSSSPVIHLAQSRSPHRIFAPPGSHSLDVGHRSHGDLPLYVTRSIFGARVHLLGGHVRQSPSRYRSSASSREDTATILVQHSRRSRASFEYRITSRNTCFARSFVLRRTALAHTTSAVTAVAGLARFAGSSPFGCFELGGTFARSPCGDSSVRSRCSDFAPSIAVSRAGASFRMRSSAVPRSSRVSPTTLRWSKSRTIRSRTSRCGRSFIRPCTPCCSCLRTCSPTLR